MLLGLAAILSGFATYAALKAMPPFGDDSDTIFWLLNLDLVILLALVSLIALRIVALWAGRRQGAAGSRLHVRLVLIFCFLAATPAILMTGFSAYFFHYGIQAWFSERVRTAVNESQAVAEAYLQEHHQVIRADVLAMANDLDRQATLLLANPGAFDRLMRTQSVLRNLSEAIVFDRSGRVLAESGLTFTLGFETVPDYALKSAEDGDVVLMTAGSDDRIRALVKLNNFFDSYLFVGRMVDPVVLSHLQDTRKAAEEYEDLQGRYSDLQVAATLIFFTVAFVILLAAVWFGLVFARQLVAPIGVLINASDRVRAGDLTARVPEAKTFDEFEYLARSFNRMTSQIQSQRDELVNANRQLDHRRRFTETILAGVSSGVAGIDNYGRITLVNSTVCELFQCEPSELSGRDICDLVPDLRPLLAAAHRRPSRIAQAEVPYALADGSRRTLLVRIAIEMIGEEDKGAVLTFDDITELLAAQRKAAWADVARRIAHEIKNPLTPIQLSAERLRRKYLRQIDEEPETFERCIETIIRHVGDIGRMVSEFSAFARMPEPIMKEENIVALIRDTVLFQQQAHASIRFRVAGDGALSPGIVCCCDASQFRQALTNLIQNSVDSIESVVAADPAHQGRVDVFVSSRGGNVYVVVSDNGAGLPKMDEVSRIAEPYVTMKEKGTGLGLAIVRKIMEDHGGRLIIGAPDWLRRSDEWTEPGGATIVLAMPVGHCEARGLDPLTSGEAA
ncbi:MAG: PAS domain-containing sensor histidine kinase [Alphaproteobacteria bacterium]|nr:PAS domain-containing sensor histidine kinase [Alphaproteobacteria bacterium]